MGALAMRRGFKGSRLLLLHLLFATWFHPPAIAAQRSAAEEDSLQQAVQWWTRLGSFYARQGHPDSALVSFRRALLIYRRLQDRPGEGATLHNLGVLSGLLGYPDSALSYFRDALQVRRDLPNRLDVARTLMSMGVAYDNTGHHDSALASLQQALLIGHEEDETELLGNTFSALGSVYGRINRLDRALEYYRAAVRLQDAYPTGKAATLSGMGLVFANRGPLDSALTYFGQALELYGNERNSRGIGQTLHSIGVLYDRQGLADSALVIYRLALQAYQAARDTQHVAMALSMIGEAHINSRHPDSALVYLGQSLQIHRAVRDRRWEGIALAFIGRAYQHPLRDFAKAAAYYDSSDAVFASIRNTAGSDANRMSFMEQDWDVPTAWPLTWLARRRQVGELASVRAALAAAERGRAQALLQLMNRGGSVAPGVDLVREGTRLAASATQGAAAFIYYLSTRDTLLIWIGWGDDSLAVARVPVSSDSIARLVVRARSELAEVDDLERCDTFGRRGDYIRPLRALSEVLLPAEVRRRLPDVGEIVLAPHGVLQLLPFAALPFGAEGTPFGVHYALRYTPSLAALEQAMRRPKARHGGWEQALVVGDPEMPAVECDTVRSTPSRLREAGVFSAGLAKQLGARYLTDKAATEAAVRSALPSAPLVHLATHGYAYQTEVRAQDSFIALTPVGKDDGLLTVGEILEGADLQADLVVLAACATGLGDSKAAEGTVGLQRALIAKGARSALVSLWTVSEAATVRLLDVFYREWLDRSGSQSKAKALRAAQDSVRNDPRHPEWRHPEFWAAFQVVGAQ